MSDTLFEPEWESVRADDLVISLHRGRTVEIRGCEFIFTGTHRGANDGEPYIVVHGRAQDGGSVAIRRDPADLVRVKAKGSGS